jgi:hypothetical protein
MTESERELLIMLGTIARDGFYDIRREHLVTLMDRIELEASIPAQPVSGMDLIATSPHPIVSMVSFDDRLFIATAGGVFERLADGKFHELKFVVKE